MPRRTKLLLFILATVSGSSLFNIIPYKAISKEQQALYNAVILRSGYPGQSKFWHYAGTVQDPYSGVPVCGIQGLEYSRCVRLESGETTNGTFLTHKAFIYTNANNNSEPMRKYQINKFSPFRNVNPTKILHELVTYSANRDGTISARVEFPSGRSLKNSRLILREQSMSGNGKKEISFINRMNVNKGRRSLLHNKWISLQQPIDTAAEGKRGTREVYSLRSAPSAPIFSFLTDGLFGRLVEMSVRRYGEGPSWLGNGKAVPCVVELTAKRYDSYNRLPASIRSLVSRQSPQFLLGMSGVRPEDRRPASDGKGNTYLYRNPLRLPTMSRKRARGDSNGDSVLKSFRDLPDLLTEHKRRTILRIFPTR